MKKVYGITLNLYEIDAKTKTTKNLIALPLDFDSDNITNIEAATEMLGSVMSAVNTMLYRIQNPQKK